MATAAAPPHEHDDRDNSAAGTVCLHCVASMYKDQRLKEVDEPLRKGSYIKACLTFDIGDDGEEELMQEHVWVRVRGDPARCEGSLKNVPAMIESCNGNRRDIRLARKLFNLPNYGSLVRWRDALRTPNMRVLTAWRTHPTDPWHAIETGVE